MDYRNYSFSKKRSNKCIKCGEQSLSRQLQQDYDALVFLCTR